MRRRLICYILLTTFLFGSIAVKLSHGEDLLRVHWIDVGYGDAVLIETPDEQTLLIDTGSRSRAADLLSYLHDQGIRRLDEVIITHPHENHYGALEDLLKQVDIRRLYVNGDGDSDQQYMDLLKTWPYPVKTLHEGTRLAISHPELTLTVLHPANLNASTNDNALVLWLKYESVSVLLSSDIGPHQQDRLLRDHPDIRSANVIQIPHHGDLLSAEWQQLLRNKIAIVSTGDNPYGLPLADDWPKLEATIYRTDHHGTIRMTTQGRDITIAPTNHSKNPTNPLPQN